MQTKIKTQGRALMQALDAAVDMIGKEGFGEAHSLYKMQADLLSDLLRDSHLETAPMKLFQFTKSLTGKEILAKAGDPANENYMAKVVAMAQEAKIKGERLERLLKKAAKAMRASGDVVFKPEPLVAPEEAVLASYMEAQPKTAGFTAPATSSPVAKVKIASEMELAAAEIVAVLRSGAEPSDEDFKVARQALVVAVADRVLAQCNTEMTRQESIRVATGVVMELATSDAFETLDKETLSVIMDSVTHDLEGVLLKKMGIEGESDDTVTVTNQAKPDIIKAGARRKGPAPKGTPHPDNIGV